jgi:predicted nucleic acid-binding protein
MIWRVHVDINVLLDVLAHREPHFAASAAVWGAAETGRIHGQVSANSLTTLYYLLRRAANRSTALEGVRLVRDVFEVVPVDLELIDRALASKRRDFEDAVLIESALRAEANAIVTRDAQHFENAGIAVMSPHRLTSAIAAE